jgi:predicted peroxiredoxin
MLNDSTSTINSRLGITSKSDSDAEKAFSKFSYGFLNLPFFFQPVVKGTLDSKKLLEFAKPSDRSKAAKKKQDTNTDGYLNTMIDYLPTVESAYDGQKMFRYLADECFAKGTKILMDDMSFKNIEDIVIGDKVTIEGGKTMVVGNTVSGIDDLFIVKQPYGKDYIVNSKHRLYFEGRNRKKQSGISIITPLEYMSLNKYMRRTLNRCLFSGIEYEEKDLSIDPYILGVWLGDGYSKHPRFIVNTNTDSEIGDAIQEYADTNNYTLSINKRKDSKCVSTYNLTDNESINVGKKGTIHKFKKHLEDLDILNKKRIPECYFTSSKRQRLELLAGIIDTDGHLTSRNSYCIGMSRKELIEDIYRLCKTLGLDTSEVIKKKSNFDTDVYSVRITGNKSIPCKVKRKQSTSNSFYKSRRAKVSVEEYGVGEYFGITLIADNDDDRRLILEDYTISMNCSKWVRGANFEKHWGQVSPTFDEGGKIVGKAFVGSTVNAMNKGGAEFKSLYLASDIKKRDKTTDRTPSGLYSFFLPAHKNMTEFTDIYGVCHETVDKGGSFVNVNGVTKSVGSIAYLEAKRKAKRKENDIAYNEELRAFPMTTEEAFRDELVRALFNTEKINEQKIFNDSVNIDSDLVRGRFAWKDGIPDTTVEWHPDNNGRFLVSWIPAPGFRNRFELRNGFGGNSKYPLNDDIGAFGCDPYDISGTVEGVSASGHYNEDTSRASKGALHGLTGFTMKDAPSNTFFLQYVARPSTAEIFFEDVLMACVFYGMPILAENNKPRLLYHFKNRGYRNFAITRFDKALNRLSPTEKELGGMPNSSEDIKQMHASAIEAYIDKYVGMNHETEEYGSMPFNLTLDDWMKFDINNRTKYDASISSGLAIMAVNRRLYSTQHESKPITVNIKRYNNR